MNTYILSIVHLRICFSISDWLSWPISVYLTSNNIYMSRLAISPSPRVEKTSEVVAAAAIEDTESRSVCKSSRCTGPLRYHRYAKFMTLWHARHNYDCRRNGGRSMGGGQANNSLNRGGRQGERLRCPSQNKNRCLSSSPFRVMSQILFYKIVHPYRHWNMAALGVTRLDETVATIAFYHLPLVCTSAV